MCAVLAVMLSGPVPALLARTPRLRLAPRAAMLLWQSVALAAVLSALGASLALLTSTEVDDLLRQDSSATPGAGAWLVAGVSVLLTGVVLGRLLLTGHRIGSRLRGTRRRHRALLNLMAAQSEGVFVLDGDEPVAYCLPGLGGHRVVLTRGTLEHLGAEEVAAVVAHERAHLMARHDLVLEAFTVLHQAFPRWVSSRSALREVRLLTEILADAAARRRCGARPLARALLALTEGSPLDAGRVAVSVPSPPHEGALAARGETSPLRARIAVLTDDRPHRVLAGGLLASAVGVLVLPTVFVAYPWLRSLL